MTAREGYSRNSQPEKTNVDRGLRLGQQWFSRGDNFHCNPLLQALFIILYWMSWITNSNATFLVKLTIVLSKCALGLTRWKAFNCDVIILWHKNIMSSINIAKLESDVNINCRMGIPSFSFVICDHRCWFNNCKHPFYRLRLCTLEWWTVRA